MKNELKKWGRRAAKGTLAAGILVVLSAIGWVLAYRFINPPTTPLMLMRKAEGLTISQSWTEFDDLPGSLAYCAVRSEDQKFLTHFGFDFNSIRQNALAAKQGAFAGGGSTITQQVAKNCFLWPGRSWLRKGLEVPFTILIELMWSKERILEIYLNVAEMGEGIFGAEAAAQAHFNKSAADLSFAEAALIAAALPSPRQFDAGHPAQRYRDRQAMIVQTITSSQTRTATSHQTMHGASDTATPTKGSDSLLYQCFGGFDFSLPENCNITGMEIHAEFGPLLYEDTDARIVIGPAFQGDDGRLQANAVPYRIANGRTTCTVGGPRLLPAAGWSVEQIHDPTFVILVGTPSAKTKNQEPADPALVYVTVYFLPDWDDFDLTINLNL